MRLLLLLLTLSVSALAEFEVAGYVGLNMQDFLAKPAGKHQYNITAEQRLELTYSEDEFKYFLNIYAQEDAYDFHEDEREHNKRTFARVDEAYIEYEGDTSKFFIGRNVRFWGALEVRNITDVFNPLEFRNDPTSGDKLGVWNAQYTHYTDSGELSVIVKFYEEEQKMAAYPYVYYFLPPVVSSPEGTVIGGQVIPSFDLAASYDSTLDSEKGQDHPSLFLTYSGSTDWDSALDYAVIYEHGYDAQRKFNINEFINKNDLNASTITFQQSVYLVNKFMTYNTMVLGSALIKLEAQAVDVISDKDISDYIHIGLGTEYTLNGLLGEADIGLMAEYYKYYRFDKEKRSDLELFETMQNDLFIGARITFNDLRDSSLIIASIIDLSYAEQVYSAKYETRLFESINIALDYQYINASENTFTAYHLMGSDPYNPKAKPIDNQRLGLDVSYHF